MFIIKETEKTFKDMAYLTMSDPVRFRVRWGGGCGNFTPPQRRVGRHRLNFPGIKGKNRECKAFRNP